MPETVDNDKTLERTRKSDLKVETEALPCAAQEQSNFDKSVDSTLCRMSNKGLNNKSYSKGK